MHAEGWLATVQKCILSLHMPNTLHTSWYSVLSLQYNSFIMPTPDEGRGREIGGRGKSGGKGERKERGKEGESWEERGKGRKGREMEGKGRGKERGEWEGERGVGRREGSGKGRGEWEGERGVGRREGSGKGRGKWEGERGVGSEKHREFERREKFQHQCNWN